MPSQSPNPSLFHIVIFRRKVNMKNTLHQIWKPHKFIATVIFCVALAWLLLHLFINLLLLLFITLFKISMAVQSLKILENIIQRCGDVGTCECQVGISCLCTRIMWSTTYFVAPRRCYSFLPNVNSGAYLPNQHHDRQSAFQIAQYMVKIIDKLPTQMWILHDKGVYATIIPQMITM